ncbi:lipopolysaccharide biosynthesis [Rhodobacterales bacterium HKCCE3408]|nr:lipopolysaccharide biosynthesis [Rhodobacterales bacterium HKCCE3408]
MTPEIRFYGRLLMRRAPVMLLLFLICAVIGLVLALRLPTTYVSSALLLMQSQQVSDVLVESTVSTDPLEEARFLEQSLMTRPNLLEIANETSVFEDIRLMSPDDVVDQMRQATTIEIAGGDNRRTGGAPVTIAVSFRTHSAQTAADVVNEYVTRLTALYSERRGTTATQTLEFFERQVDRLGTELDERSSQITEFQRQNADALPEDQEFRLSRLSLLQERLGGAERERRSLTEQRARTIQVYNSTEGRGLGGSGSQLTPDEQELQQLRNQLSTLLLTFSETAPQVTQVQRRITQLEDRIAAQAPTLPEVEEDGEALPPLLALQLAPIDSRLEELEALITETQAEITRLEAAIGQSPLNGIALQQLQRDYENIQLQYDSARRNLAQARMGETIETSDSGRRMALIEPAVVPSAPASPNRPLIAAGGIGAGIVLAATFFLALEVLNRSVRRPVEIERALGITPLATVPYLESANRRFLRRTVRLAAVLVVLAGVPAALWAVDQYYLPLDQLAARILDRLGIA